MMLIHLLHLLQIAARHHSALHAMRLHIFQKSFESRNVRKRHIQLELIEPGCYLSLFRLAIGVSINMSECGIVREVLVVDLNQSLSLDAKRKVRHLRMILPAYHSPEHGILAFGIENHAV